MALSSTVLLLGISFRYNPATVESGMSMTHGTRPSAAHERIRTTIAQLDEHLKKVSKARSELTELDPSMTALALREAQLAAARELNVRMLADQQQPDVSYAAGQQTG